MYDELAMVAYLQLVRILTQEQVDERANKHDKEDMTPNEWYETHSHHVVGFEAAH